MLTWEPKIEGIQEICSLLTDTQSHDNRKQRENYEKLERISGSSEFIHYLSYILCEVGRIATETRLVAGLVLKVEIEKHCNRIQTEILEFVKEKVLKAFYDKEINIRKIVNNIITTIVLKCGLVIWPNLMEFLFSALNSPEVLIIESGVDCLSKIIDDSVKLFEYEGNRELLAALLPKLIELIPRLELSSEARSQALFTINILIFSLGSLLLPYLESLYPIILQLGGDSGTPPVIRQKICECLVCLLNCNRDWVFSNHAIIIDIVLYNMQFTDHAVSLSACEFWPQYVGSKDRGDKVDEKPFDHKFHILQTYLPRLLPLLLECMKYGEADLMSMIPDKEEDFKYAYKEDIMKGVKSNSKDKEKEKEDDTEAQNTLRKVAAVTLDHLSKIYKDEVFKILKPVIEKYLDRLQSWEFREAATLALGALAEGSMEVIRPHLNNLIAFLLEQMNASEPLIRSITCWTISRFSKWIVEQDRESNNILKIYLGELLRRVLDSDSNVQEAACSSFSMLISIGANKLEPYIFDILNVFAAVFDQYKGNSLYNLYDAIGSLAESLGESIRNEKILNALMPPLIAKWNVLKDNDRSLCPLLECFESIACAMGPYFEKFAQPVFDRCLSIMDQTLNLIEDPEQKDIEKEFLIRSMDLLGALAEALGHKMEVIATNSKIISVTLRCMEHKDMQIRQYIFALLGDLSKACGSHIQPAIQHLVPPLYKDLSYFTELSLQQQQFGFGGTDSTQHLSYLSVCNNACWCIGELAMQFPANMSEYIPAVSKQLVTILQSPKLNKSLAQNVSLTIGRLSLINPLEISSYLPQFLKQWCLSLRYISDGPEKQQAFQGMCDMIPHNPSGAISHFPYLCDALVEYKNPSPELEQVFGALLRCFKQGIGQEWNNYFAKFPLELRKQLNSRFNL